MAKPGDAYGKGRFLRFEPKTQGNIEFENGIVYDKDDGRDDAHKNIAHSISSKESRHKSIRFRNFRRDIEGFGFRGGALFSKSKKM